MSSGFDIESVAKMNEEEGRKQLAFEQNKVKHTPSFAEKLEQSNPSVGKLARAAALENQQKRVDNMINPNGHDLPLARDEIQGDPRLAYGTGTSAYDIGTVVTVNDAKKTKSQVNKLNLATMYNLKELHERKTKTNAESPQDPATTILEPGPPGPKDTNGATNVGANQGPFKSREFMTVFDNYKLYKDGTLRNKKSKILKGRNGYFKINGKRIAQSEIMAKYGDYVNA